MSATPSRLGLVLTNQFCFSLWELSEWLDLLPNPEKHPEVNAGHTSPQLGTHAEIPLIGKTIPILRERLANGDPHRSAQIPELYKMPGFSPLWHHYGDLRYGMFCLDSI